MKWQIGSVVEILDTLRQGIGLKRGLPVCEHVDDDKDVVESALLAKGFIVTDGVTFGADYSIYRGLPGSMHSDALVFKAMETMTMEDLVLRNRTEFLFIVDLGTNKYSRRGLCEYPPSENFIMRARSSEGGSEYANRRALSIVLDDPMLEDSLGHQLNVFKKGGRESHIDENLPRPASGQQRSSADVDRSMSDSMAPSSGGFLLDPSHIRDNREAASHMQSADLFDLVSPVQRDRQKMQPKLADIFNASSGTWLQPITVPNLKIDDAEEIRKRFPHISAKSAVQIQPIMDPGEAAKFLSTRRRLRIGLVLSGGPAPGGHNVIAGVQDYIKRRNPENLLFGFKGGLDGFFTRDSITVDETRMSRFRNTGGFDMLWSGRGKVNDGDKPQVIQNVKDLDLQGLIIVGGDGSNSNAAILADYLAKECPECSVIGVPKTIDGDLKSAAIECSFGFDTAAKTYSELIGNLCTDVCASQGTYHFVRVMGRSASHLTLECAMQCRPNLVFIGEEVREQQQSMKSIVGTIFDLIVERAKLGKRYGIILIPEGLIEFVPEMTELIRELSELTAKGKVLDETKLSQPMQELWAYLGADIQMQLLEKRESSGYIQVAKIATERLLIRAVENQLQEKAPDVQFTPMHHYFGYEGRCAMPSNFDANYCYNLGFTAACLIDHAQTGYMATVRGLEHDASSWLPTGVPFTQLMSMQTLPDGSQIPGIKRQLVDIESESFKVFQKVREHWRLGDYYRCPGPIQFEGPVSDITNFVVHTPTPDELLSGQDPLLQTLLGEGRVFNPKRLGCYSALQHERLKWRPVVPPMCENVRARCFPGQKHMPKDPYVRRQITQYYRLSCEDSRFMLQEVRIDPCHQMRRGIRIGVFLISRPSPGCMNILWGLHERAKLSGSTILGFHGVQGVIDMKFIEFKDEDFTAYKNLGGWDLLGRTSNHVLLRPEVQEQVERSCRHLKLDGLVLIGSSLGMTEAAMLSEFLLKRRCRTRVIGIPATTSNNVLHDLIETNVGFDTAAKLYSSLIGNVLTDASSMPKYWHFIRLMGRYPSNEVLECALQTHPNVVIIGEEYGAGQKALDDVVQDIAEVVCRRAEGVDGKLKRNFGAVLIPDGLLQHLPEMRSLLNDLNAILQAAARKNEFKQARDELLAMDEANEFYTPTADSSPNADTPSAGYANQLTPWSAALWRSLPVFIKRELAQINIELRDSSVEMELWLHQLVKKEVEKRRERGEYNGTFQVCTHYFGYQGRSAIPSVFDATLAFVHGHLAAIAVESGLTGHLTNVRGLCGDIHDWKLTTVPFTCLVTVVPTQQDFQVHPDLIAARHQANQEDLPIIPNAEINLGCRALRWMKYAQRWWENEDKFCNPGPIQFWGVPSTFYHRILHEEQADYFHMLTQVKRFTKYLQDGCDFGVEETFLKTAYVMLNSLLTLMYHPDEVTHSMPPFPRQAELDSRANELYKNFYGSASAAMDYDEGAQRMRRAISSMGVDAARTGSRDGGFPREGSQYGRHTDRLANVPEELEEESPKARLT